MDKGKVILPPPSHRRDKTSILTFLRLGNGQKKAIFKEWQDCSFEINFDDDIEEEGVVYEENYQEIIFAHKHSSKKVVAMLLGLQLHTKSF